MKNIDNATIKNKVVMMFNMFKWYEMVIFVLGLIAIVVLSIVYKSTALTVLLSLSGIVYVFLLAKQIKFSVVFGTIQTILYVVQAIIYHNWGEVISNGLVVLPLLIISLVTWFYKSGKQITVQPKKISWKEILILIAVDAVCAIAFYFILGHFQTPYLIVATLSLYFTFMGNYFLVRKTVLMFYVFCLSTSMMIILWALPIFERQEQNFETIPMLVLLFFYILSNILGILNWKKNKLTEDDKISINEKDISI